MKPIKNWTEGLATINKPSILDKAHMPKADVQQTQKAEVKDRVDLSSKKASKMHRLYNYVTGRGVENSAFVSKLLTSTAKEAKCFEAHLEDARQNAELSSRRSEWVRGYAELLARLAKNEELLNSALADYIADYIEKICNVIKNLDVCYTKISSAEAFSVLKINDKHYSVTYKGQAKGGYSSATPGEIKFSLIKGDGGLEIKFDRDPSASKEENFRKLLDINTVLAKLNDTGALRLKPSNNRAS